MKINTKFNYGQVVYYWDNYTTVGSVKLSVSQFSRDRDSFEWHLEKSDIYGIKIIMDSAKKLGISYFLMGRYIPQYEVFATKEKAMKHRPE